MTGPVQNFYKCFTIVVASYPYSFGLMGYEMKINKIGIISAAIGAFMATVSASQAATCSISGVNFSLDIAAGSTCMAGNDLGSGGIDDGNLNFFGFTNWAVGDSTDLSQGDDSVQFASAPVVLATSGTWSLQPYSGFDAVMIVLKSGKTYGAFLLDKMASGLSGSWSITGDQNCNRNGCATTGKQLSHASVYYSGVPSPVPLPAAGFLLIGGLAGLAALRRKRRTI